MTTTIPTLKDVARHAGVSIATVSYVLNGRQQSHKTISDATCQRVMQAVAELGYTPNQAARHLRRQRTECICIVLPRLGVPYYEVLCRSVEAVVERSGYSVLLSLTGSREKERKVLGQLQRRFADGVIAIHGTWESEELAQLAASGIAVIAMDNYIQPLSFDVIRTTEEQAFYDAITYLLRKGYQRIACLYGAEKRETRLPAYRRALSDGGLNVDEGLLAPGSGTREQAYQSTLQLMRLKEPPDALFTGSDVSAISAIWAAKDVGLRVPEDIAIIGAGNIPEGEISTPSLTTVGPVSPDFTDVAELVLDRLQDPARPERVLLRPWELILRGSA